MLSIASHDPRLSLFLRSPLLIFRFLTFHTSQSSKGGRTNTDRPPPRLIHKSARIFTDKSHSFYICPHSTKTGVTSVDTPPLKVIHNLLRTRTDAPDYLSDLFRTAERNTGNGREPPPVTVPENDLFPVPRQKL